MKILYREFQQDAFKEIVEIIKVLAKRDGDDVTEAIKSAFELARIIGVEKDLDRLAAAPEEENADYDKWTNMFCLRTILRDSFYKPMCSRKQGRRRSLKEYLLHMRFQRGGWR